MTFKLDVDFKLLDLAIKTMGAELVEIDLSSEVLPIEPIDRQLNQGLEVNLKDIEFDTGLASYQGRQVLLYIKDHSFGDKFSKALKDGSEGNKFHVADCSWLDGMRRKGRFDRYVVTNRVDGLFAISGHDLQTKESIDGEARLSVCQYCLEGINYKKFASIPRGARRREFVCSFKLNDFFDTYSSFFKFMPAVAVDKNAIKYTDDWDQISKRVREKCAYQCQQCGLNLINNKRLLHVHHINGVKSDNKLSNLTPLCCDCHRKQPDHQHMYVSHEDTKLIAQLRNAQGLNIRESWKDIYDLADPGMHGVIDLLEQYGVSLPEVGEEIQNEKNEVVAELELAWPIKKVGIAINKSEAIAATKLGWKVYSMRHALSEIDQLTGSLR